MACTLVLEDRQLIRAESAVSAHVDLAATPVAAPLGRRFVREHLQEAVSARVLHDVLLLTTELVTNAVLHARTALHLGVSYDETNVLVTVQDENATTPPLDGRGSGPNHLSESGRGMALIADIADDFGWVPLPSSPGKVMWFVVGRR